MKSLFLILLNILANLDPFLLPHNFFVILFTYMFLAVLDLHCRAAFLQLQWVSGATLLGSVLALIAAVSLVGRRPQGVWASVTLARGLHSCGSLALEHSLRSCTWCWKMLAHKLSCSVHMESSCTGMCLPHWEADSLSLGHQGSSHITFKIRKFQLPWNMSGF